ncbi:MAG TPA: flippase [Puia sp.]|uniref:flippase n=1 Tax=Puia sp. TaxID=2045100 RepID=UPI002C9B19FD|nr:flippase [Puia sp.]HVU95079.1 flippase [Puia sp.]
MVKKYLSSYWIRSAFYTVLQRFSITLFGLINFIVLIRSLSKAQMGSWALFLVVTSIFEITKSGLLKNAHIRYVSSSTDKEDKAAIASSSLLINASISAIFITLILVFSDHVSVWLHTGQELATMLKWFIPGLIAMVFYSHLEAIQQSHLDFKGVFAGGFVRQVLFFLMIAGHMVLHKPYSVRLLALYQSIAIIIGTIIIYLYSRPYILHRFNPSKRWTKQIFNYGGYIFSSGIISNLVTNLDQVMTARFMPDASSVAYYNAASRINQLIDIPSFAAAEVIFPKVSMASTAEGPEKVRYLFERMVAVLLCFTAPTALLIILFPNLVIQIIAGSKYAAAAPILRLYMVTGILRPMQHQAANLLNSIGKSGLCFYLNTGSLLVNLLLNYIFFSYIGFYGAALGTLATFILGAFVWYKVMNREIGMKLSTIGTYMIVQYKTIFTNVLGLISQKKAS